MSHSNETGEQVQPPEYDEEAQVQEEHTTGPTVEEDQPLVHEDSPDQAQARRLVETIGRVTHVAQSEEEEKEPVAEEDAHSLNAVNDVRHPLRGERPLSDVAEKDAST